MNDMQINITGMLAYYILDRMEQEDPESVTMVTENVSATLLIQISNSHGHPSVAVPSFRSKIQKLLMIFGPESPSSISPPWICYKIFLF